MKGMLCLVLCLALLGSGCTSTEQRLNLTNSVFQNDSAPTTSNEVDCGIVLAPERLVVMELQSVQGTSASYAVFFGPQLKPGFSLAFNRGDDWGDCESGTSVGQNVNHLYCHLNPGWTYHKAVRINVNKEGVIESNECYFVELNELAPGNVSKSWEIVNVTCERC